MEDAESNRINEFLKLIFQSIFFFFLISCHRLSLYSVLWKYSCMVEYN